MTAKTNTDKFGQYATIQLTLLVDQAIKVIISYSALRMSPVLEVKLLDPARSENYVMKNWSFTNKVLSDNGRGVRTVKNTKIDCSVPNQTYHIMR